MNKKMINEDKYPARCEYCAHGRKSADDGIVLCVKKGVVETDDSCRSYKYDVLKRKPLKKPSIEEADPSDFEL